MSLEVADQIMFRSSLYLILSAPSQKGRSVNAHGMNGVNDREEICSDFERNFAISKLQLKFQLQLVKHSVCV